MALEKELKSWANRYSQVSVIGKGSYGVVYKVKDSQSSEGPEMSKALKEIVVVRMDPDESDELSREGRLLSRMNHTHILRFYNAFSTGSVYCIVTEFCDGGDIGQLMTMTKKRGERLPEQRILRWFVQLMQALEYIHNRKILHRDIKCRNIFLKNDSVKLGDFGISRILNCTTDLASTFVGTASYMSPEVLKMDGYSTVSDIWSAGVVLYEMCALKHAFDADGLMNVMMLIVEGDCPVVPMPFYSDGIQDVISRMLAKDPAKRPSAQEVLQLEIIEKFRREPWSHLVEYVDLSSTLIAKEADDIRTYLSESNTIRAIEVKDEVVDTLTPKQRQLLRKKQQADKKADELKKVGTKIYLENREKNNIHRVRTQIETMPFTKKRFQHSTSLTEKAEEGYNLSKEDTNKRNGIGLAKTYQPQSRTAAEFSPPCLNLNQTFTFESPRPSDCLKQDPRMDIGRENSNSQFLPASNNQNELFRVLSDMDESCSVLPNVAESGPYSCKVTTFDPADIPADVNYSDDFDSASTDSNQDNGSNSDDDSNLAQKPEIFKDDNETDPFGQKSKIKKLDNMKMRSVKLIGEDTLKRAFSFINNCCTKKNYLSQLRDICRNDEAAFLVEQIFFLNDSHQ